MMFVEKYNPAPHELIEPRVHCKNGLKGWTRKVDKVFVLSMRRKNCLVILSPFFTVYELYHTNLWEEPLIFLS